VLVLDEADLLLSYGYEEDVRALAPHVPRSAQVGGAAAHAATQRRPVAAHGCFQQAGQRRQWLVELLPRAAALCLPCLAKAALRRRLHDVLCNWPLLWLQCMLMSATSSEEVDRLTQLVLHNPVALNLLGKATGEGDEVRGNTARGGEGGGARQHRVAGRLWQPRPDRKSSGCAVPVQRRAAYPAHLCACAGSGGCHGRRRGG
jgi:superfamily II DNA/RNA helicase